MKNTNPCSCAEKVIENKGGDLEAQKEASKVTQDYLDNGYPEIYAIENGIDAGIQLIN